MTSVILDASAALAMVRQEKGGERVVGRVRGSRMSAVNLAEVAQRFWREGADPEPWIRGLHAGGMTVAAADANLALAAAALERLTMPFGLSLADRFCLALALHEQLPLLTADKPFAQLGLPIAVELIR
jgi:ribonuclease VapC